MEWYFATILRDSAAYLASSVETATYIYFAQCVSQVYFSIRDELDCPHWDAIALAEREYLIPLMRWAHGTPAHRIP
eukprot:3105233-Amphidinium_carterae.1